MKNYLKIKSESGDFLMEFRWRWLDISKTWNYVLKLKTIHGAGDIGYLYIKEWNDISLCKFNHQTHMN